MNTYNVAIPTRFQAEVLVVGGGPAGLAAALSAARRGAKVLLADRNGCLGGTATAGLVGPFMTSYDPEGERQVIQGIYEEVLQRMVQEQGAIHPSEIQAGSSYAGYRVYGHAHCAPFDAEILKRVAEEMCLESGVELLYHAMLVDTCLNETGDRIKGAIFATKSGLIQINAEQVIDCTGDADVAHWSQVPMMYGNEAGETQPGSMFFIVRGVDKSKLEQVRETTGDFTSLFFQTEVEEEMRSGRYQVPRNKIALYENPDGTFRVNMSRVFVKDVSDPFEMTRATIQGRRQIPDILALLRRIVPGCEHVELVESASMLGLRETRRIHGEFVLTGEDIKEKRRFDDVIFLAGNSIDIHGGNSTNYQPASGDPYQIPYRILLPQKINNLLVAGRCCSMDRTALAAIRVMPPVFAMGQAAGTAAALCVRRGLDPAQISVAELQKWLVEDGVILE